VQDVSVGHLVPEIKRTLCAWENLQSALSCKNQFIQISHYNHIPKFNPATPQPKNPTPQFNQYSPQLNPATQKLNQASPKLNQASQKLILASPKLIPTTQKFIPATLQRNPPHRNSTLHHQNLQFIKPNT